MENRNFHQLRTPEKKLSESSDDNKIEEPLTPPTQEKNEDECRAWNMPRIYGSGIGTRSYNSGNDPLSALVKNLENRPLLKDGFDLEELKRKQEDLLMIQKLVQK